MASTVGPLTGKFGPITGRGIQELVATSLLQDILFRNRERCFPHNKLNLVLDHRSSHVAAPPEIARNNRESKCA